MIVDVVGHVLGDIVLEVVVDVLIDVLLRPIPPEGLKDPEQLRGELERRVIRAKRVVELASREGPAPSSRELAALRRMILKSRAAK